MKQVQEEREEKVFFIASLCTKYKHNTVEIQYIHTPTHTLLQLPTRVFQLQDYITILLR